MNNPKPLFSFWSPSVVPESRLREGVVLSVLNFGSRAESRGGSRAESRDSTQLGDQLGDRLGDQLG